LEVLVDREEAELVRLAEALDPVRGADEILELEHREVAVALRDIHPRDLQLGLVDEDRSDMAVDPDLGREPRLDDQDAAGLEVSSHRRKRRAQALLGPYVPDAAEHADDRVEAL